MRRLLAVKDSAVQGATEELNNSKRDSLAAQAENLKESRKRERDLATLDSLVPALQDEKTGCFAFVKRFLLDSAIEAISAQLGDFLNKPYEVRSEATGPDAEKAQTLDFDKGNSKPQCGTKRLPLWSPRSRVHRGGTGTRAWAP